MKKPMHPDETARFTIFWMNGMSEVISAFPGEHFHKAFERHGYGYMAIATMSTFKTGSVMADYRYDPKTYEWHLKNNASRDYNRFMNMFASVAEDAPYQMAT